MADVKPGAARMGVEHIQYIALRPGRIIDNVVGAVRYPSLLPFLFNIAEVIFHKPCWEKVKSSSGPEIMRTNNRLEENKNTEMAVNLPSNRREDGAESFIFAQTKSGLRPA